MRRIGVWFVLLNKRLFKKYSFLLILCLVPLLVGGLRMAASQDRGIVAIALAMENSEDPLAVQVLEGLKEDNGVLRYVVCDTPKEARELVTSGRADAAWIFPENLEVSLRTAAAVKKVVPVVTVIERGDTVSLIFAREVLCSALYPYFSYAVYEDYVRDDLGIDANAQELEEAYLATLVEGNLFQLEYMDGQVVEEGDYLLAPVRGILALWLVLCGFAASMYFLQDEREGFFARTQEKRKIWASFAVHGVLLLDAAVVLLAACALAGVFTLPGRELLSAALFVFCVLAFCNLVRLLCGTVERLGVCIPILLAGMAVLCPVFLNIGGWRAVKYLLPPYYYLMSIHRTEYLWGMVVYACVTATLCVCVDRLKHKMFFAARMR